MLKIVKNETNTKTRLYKLTDFNADLAQGFVRLITLDIDNELLVEVIDTYNQESLEREQDYLSFGYKKLGYSSEIAINKKLADEVTEDINRVVSLVSKLKKFGVVTLRSKDLLNVDNGVVEIFDLILDSATENKLKKIEIEWRYPSNFVISKVYLPIYVDTLAEVHSFIDAFSKTKFVISIRRENTNDKYKISVFSELIQSEDEMLLMVEQYHSSIEMYEK